MAADAQHFLLLSAIGSCVVSVRSSHTPSGSAMLAVGVRCPTACSASRSSQARSLAGSASRTSRSPTSARACAPAIPGRKPDSSACGQAAVTMSRWPTRSIMMVGRARSACAGLSARPKVVPSAASRAHRAPGRQPPPRGTKQAPGSSSTGGSERTAPRAAQPVWLPTPTAIAARSGAAADRARRPVSSHASTSTEKGLPFCCRTSD